MTIALDIFFSTLVHSYLSHTLSHKMIITLIILYKKKKYELKFEKFRKNFTGTTITLLTTITLHNTMLLQLIVIPITVVLVVITIMRTQAMAMGLTANVWMKMLQVHKWFIHIWFYSFLYVFFAQHFRNNRCLLTKFFVLCTTQ